LSSSDTPNKNTISDRQQEGSQNQEIRVNRQAEALLLSITEKKNAFITPAKGEAEVTRLFQGSASCRTRGGFCPAP